MTTSTPRKTAGKPHRKRFGCILKFFCGVFLLLTAAAGGGYMWLNSWKWYPLPAFHESWTAEERTALSRFDSYLTNGDLEKDFLMGMNTVSENIDSLQARLGLERASAAERFRIRLEQQALTLYMSRLLGKPMRRELAAIVTSGSAKREPPAIQASVKDTPARFALYTGNTEAAKAMIRHGADVNFRGVGTKESLLSCLLSDRSLKGTHPMPLQERLSTADWLVQQGADVHRLRECLRYAPQLAGQEQESILRWLHAHGFGTEPYEDGCPVYEHMSHAVGYAFWKEMFASGRLSLNDNRGNRTPLQVLCSHISSEEQVDMLEWMLRRGASPNMPAQQEGLFPREQPLELALTSLCMLADEPEEAAPAFRAVRLLQRHGAVIPGQDALPDTDDMQEFLRLYRKQSQRKLRRDK